MVFNILIRWKKPLIIAAVLVVALILLAVGVWLASKEGFVNKEIKAESIFNWWNSTSDRLPQI